MPTVSDAKLGSSLSRRAASKKVTTEVRISGHPSSPIRLWMFALVLALWTFLAYLPVLHYPFVSLDDVDYVTANQHVQRGLSLSTVSWAVTTTDAGNWHPLTWMSHALDCDLFGLDASGHHLSNLLFHIANSILIFLLLCYATGAKWRSAFVAALFALHPMNVESAAWIAERKTVLSMFFFLLALAAYGWYARKPQFKRYALLFGLSVLALSAKPMVVTLPFVLLLLDIWPLQRIDNPFLQTTSAANPSTLPRYSLSRLLIEKIPLFALSIASCLVTLIAQQPAMKSMEQIPMGQRIANAIFSYVMYLIKVVWPSRLSVYYAPMGGKVPRWEVLLCAAILISGTIAAWKVRSRPFFLVGWLWFLGTLIPMIGLVQVGEQGMADRYAYVPYLGIFVLATWGIANLHLERKFGSNAIAIGAIAILIVLSVLTWRQVHTWQSSLALWSHSLEITPANWSAEDAVGSILMQQGLNDTGQSCTEQAMVHFQNAVRIYSGDALGQLNLGFCQQSRGRFSEAIGHYDAGLQSARTVFMKARAYLDLGAAYDDQHIYDKAQAYFAQGLQLSPDDPQLRRAIAKVQSEEKVIDLSRITHPTSTEYLQMGELQAELGRITEAQASIQNALRLDPQSAEARSVLNSINQAVR